MSLEHATLAVRSTEEVARDLGINLSTIRNLVWRGGLIPPPKAGRTFVWGARDVQRLREALVKEGHLPGEKPS
jgi:hypothetical protein